ncbi:transcription factor HES-5-like [Carassius gibelio]|uniref:transcription factor HES-5-like n=1 Tax=Carassius gibelio TaxID=101364 RepID=UPI0022779677|nr:transcription factor HES-5-like [Carassius gibelio]
MAPHSDMLVHLHFSDKDKIKLRKPIVEKMRRDRINSCIDQLKSLLEKEFHSQDPSAKLEKADVLEMTVSFLKQQRQQLPQRDYNEGYSHCWRESVHFLTLHSTGGGSARELQHLHNGQQTSAAISSASTGSSSKLSTPGLQQLDIRRPVWRPW